MRIENRRVRLLPAAIAAVALLAGADDDKPAAVVPAAEARDHIDMTCTVEMTVRSSKNAAPRREYYLKVSRSGGGSEILETCGPEE